MAANSPRVPDEQQSVLELLRSFAPTFGSKQIILWETKDPEPIATKCIAEICETKRDRTTAKAAVTRFFRSLFVLPPVKAVAFVSVNFPSAPTTLEVVFFLDLMPESPESEPTMMAVSDAYTRLSQDVREIITTAIGYVDVVNKSVTTVANELEHQWDTDPLSHLLRIAHIRRTRR